MNTLIAFAVLFADLIKSNHQQMWSFDASILWCKNSELYRILLLERSKCRVIKELNGIYEMLLLERSKCTVIKELNGIYELLLLERSKCTVIKEWPI